MRRLDRAAYETFKHPRDDAPVNLFDDKTLMVLASILDLPPGRARRLQVLAEVRQQAYGALLHDMLTTLLRGWPGRFREGRLLKELDIASANVVDQVFTRLVLGSGRTFYGCRSDPKHVRIYDLIEPVLPDAIDVETYQLAVEISERYLLRHPRVFPPPGAIVIEGGCYTGLKAIRWAEWLGDDATVIAVEIDRTNSELLRRNVAANNLGAVVRPMQCGIWNDDQQVTNRHNSGRRNFLHSTNEWEADEVHATDVQGLTLDTIISRNDLPHVDYPIIQMNGAELQALAGLQQRLDDVKVIRVAAYYSTDGVPNAEFVEAWARDVGWTVSAGGSLAGNLLLTNPRWADEVATWDSRQPE